MPALMLKAIRKPQFPATAPDYYAAAIEHLAHAFQVIEHASRPEAPHADDEGHQDRHRCSSKGL